MKRRTHTRTASLIPEIKRLRIDQTNRETHQETPLDPIKRDWQIFRGPPDYTHASLASIYASNIQVDAKSFDIGLRLTSPYQPWMSTTTSDLNPGAGVTTVYTANHAGSLGFQTQYWDFYATMYEYYSVLACRYHISIENYSPDTLWMHILEYNQTLPPANASNEDMCLWKDCKSYRLTPFAQFYSGTSGHHLETSNENVEWEPTLGPNYNTEYASYAVSRQNGAVKTVSGEYEAGGTRREIALDNSISTWTRTNTSPAYPEHLLIRVATEEASTGSLTAQGDNATRDRHIKFNVRVEVEYLVEFRQLNDAVRWPTRRDPITTVLTSQLYNVQ